MTIPTIPNEHADKVCKMREGAGCCRYIMMAPEGLQCAKDPANAGFRKTIDARASQMTAQGDHCEGYDA